MLKKQFVGVGVFLAISGILSNSTFADTKSRANIEGSTDNSRGFIQDHVFLGLFSTYHGSPLGNIASSSTLNHLGKPVRGTMYFDSEITAAYLFNPTVGLGPVIPFIIVPVMGKGFILGDLGVKVFNTKTVSIDRLHVLTNLIVQVPTSQNSQEKNMKFALKTTPNIRYSFQDSRFSIGAWTEAKAYFGVSSDKDFKLYGAPYVSYRLSPTFSLNLEYEVVAHHDVGHPILDFSIYQSDFEPGLVWMITPKILVNPFLQIFTGNKLSLDTTAMGAIISANL